MKQQSGVHLLHRKRRATVERHAVERAKALQTLDMAATFEEQNVLRP